VQGGLCAFGKGFVGVLAVFREGRAGADSLVVGGTAPAILLFRGIGGGNLNVPETTDLGFKPGHLLFYERNPRNP
jgi:hypothetical protein